MDPNLKCSTDDEEGSCWRLVPVPDGPGTLGLDRATAVLGDERAVALPDDDERRDSADVVLLLQWVALNIRQMMKKVCNVLWNNELLKDRT